LNFTQENKLFDGINILLLSLQNIEDRNTLFSFSK